MAATAAAQPAPWDVAAPEDQLFVLITGANGGIGLSTGERLIDEFLATRPLTAHLVLLPTTRSASKSRSSVHALRSYADRAAQTSSQLRSRAGGDGYRWQEHARRVHILSPQIDLCDIRAVYSLARRMCHGTLGNPEGTSGPDGDLKSVAIPRLDSVVFNAAYGGWSGCNYPYAIWSILVDGLVEAVTWPKFKMVMPTRLLNEQPSYHYPANPPLGEVFSACVFGHYLLARQLLPLLGRPRDSPLSPGRIVWTSSLEGVDGVFDLSDFQALRASSAPYESAKRLTDILSLSHTLPSVQPLAKAYLGGDGGEDVVPPRIYLTHPGVVASTIFPVPWFFFWAYELALTLARWLGSPWHCVDAYTGSSSVAWITLREQPSLDALDAERSKWGSATDRKCVAYAKRTEVDGWGWTGSVGDSPDADDADANGVSDDDDATEVPRVLRRSVGRQRNARPVTDEGLAEFEELGRECWERMEGLRREWEKVLEL